MLVLKKSKDVTYTPSMQPERIILSNNVTLFGRSIEHVDVVMDSAMYPLMISRVHAKISKDGDHFCIECNSLNGILVNSIKRKKSTLKHGDIVVFGGAGTRTAEGSVILKPSSELVYVFKNDNGHKTDTSYNNMTSGKSSISDITQCSSQAQSFHSMKEDQKYARDNLLCNMNSSVERSSALHKSNIVDKKETMAVNLNLKCSVQNEGNCKGHLKDANPNEKLILSPRLQCPVFENTYCYSPVEGTSNGLTVIDNNDKKIKSPTVHTDIKEKFSTEEDEIVKRKKKRSRILFDSDDDR